MKKATCTILILAILAVFGCSGVTFKPGPIENLGLSIAAKTLGQKMQNHFKWQDDYDTFIAMIENDGVSLNSGQLLVGTILPKVPALYRSDALMLLEDLNFEFKDGALADVSGVDTALLMTAIGAFKEGLFFKQ